MLITKYTPECVSLIQIACRTVLKDFILYVAQLMSMILWQDKVSGYESERLEWESDGPQLVTEVLWRNGQRV